MSVTDWGIQLIPFSVHEVRKHLRSGCLDTQEKNEGRGKVETPALRVFTIPEPFAALKSLKSSTLCFTVVCSSAMQTNLGSPETAVAEQLRQVFTSLLSEWLSQLQCFVNPWCSCSCKIRGERIHVVPRVTCTSYSVQIDATYAAEILHDHHLRSDAMFANSNQNRTRRKDTINTVLLAFCRSCKYHQVSVAAATKQQMRSLKRWNGSKLPKNDHVISFG